VSKKNVCKHERRDDFVELEIKRENERLLCRISTEI
jgi:hypothetical protein